VVDAGPSPPLDSLDFKTEEPDALKTAQVHYARDLNWCRVHRMDIVPIGQQQEEQQQPNTHKEPLSTKE
jgi:hypothetical protein